MARALITGVTGQDGSYLAESLVARGWDVHGLATPADPGLPALLALAPQVQVHEGDLADAGGIQSLLDTVRPDHVYNLGGISSVGLSWERPILTGLVTGMGPAAVLEASLRLQERTGRPVRVLQASSAEIFGSPDRAPQDESTPIAPINPYGAAKAYAHHLVSVYRSRGLHASTVILFNHESPRRPDTFVTRKITRAAAMIARGKQHRLSLGNLEARRDWGWAPDYVEAIRLAAEHDDPSDYVVATGHAHSVRDFAEAAFTHAGVNDWQDRIDVDAGLVRPTDARLQVGDATRAHERLGWTTTVDFKDMVGRMVDVDLGGTSA